MSGGLGPAWDRRYRPLSVAAASKQSASDPNPTTEASMSVPDIMKQRREANMSASIADVRRIAREEFARCWALVDSEGRFSPTAGQEPDTPPQDGRQVPPAQSPAPDPASETPLGTGGSHD
jgi:hypothetical protein